MASEKGTIRSLVTWIVRIIVGGVFIFSGFVKAVDPWGTMYKVDDYLNVMSLNIWPNLVVVGVFLLCGIEFLIGVFIVLGCFRRSAPIMAAVLMTFMVPLTLWIAVKNPVPDCGCFGDALVISNWATFWKNIILCLGIWWLIRNNKANTWLVTPALQWILFILTAIFIVVIELYGYVSQPLLDFRNYPVGEALIDGTESDGNDVEFTFIYEKEGKLREFQENDTLPSEEDGWVFVERKEKSTPSQVEKESGEKSFRFWDTDDEDVTTDVIRGEGPELLVMIPDLKSVSPATTWKLNSLYEWSEKNDVSMIGIVSGDDKDLDEWIDLSMASYPIYRADDTQIKEVVRGNPAIVYLLDGRVVWKSTLVAINIDDFLSPETASDASDFGVDNTQILKNCIGLYCICITVLIIMSFMPKLRFLFFKKRKPENDSPVQS